MPVMPIRKFTLEFIHRLIEMKVPESDFLEYKSDLRFGTIEERKELLADVSSFANSGGGNIIYGIEEGDEGEPVSICGLTKFNIDQDIAALDTILERGLSRPIPGLEIRVISREASNPLVVIHIPFSLTGPHCIGVDSDLSGYFMRSSSKRQQMTRSEIQEAEHFIRRLRPKLCDLQNRAAHKILSERKGVSLENAGKIVVLLVPADALMRRSRIEIDKIPSCAQGKPIFGYPELSSQFNPKGWLRLHGTGEGGGAYVQYFDNGIIEAVDTTTIRSIYTNNQEVPLKGGSGIQTARSVAKLRIEHCIIQEVKSGFSVIVNAEVDFPLYVNIAVSGLSGFPGARRRRKKVAVELEPTRSLDADTEGTGETTKYVSGFFVVTIRTESSDVALSLKPAFEDLWESLGWAF